MRKGEETRTHLIIVFMIFFQRDQHFVFIAKERCSGIDCLLRNFTFNHPDKGDAMSVPAVLGLVVLAGYMIFALCSNILYWYETLNSPEPGIPSPRPGFFTCLFTYANTLGSYLMCAVVFVLGPFSHCKIEKTPDQRPDLPPLILIHGLFNTAAVWLYLGRRFRKAGHPVSTYSYRSLFTSPQRILQALDAHVRAVEAAFPGQKPVFVCHSLGGLLVRHWLLAPQNRERAGGVLTLGTPHKGSKVAALGPGSLAKNILPGAAFMLALQDPPASEPFPCVSLVSPTDEAVLPASSLLPPQGWRMRVTNMAGHFSMLFCLRVAGIAMQELEKIHSEVV